MSLQRIVPDSKEHWLGLRKGRMTSSVVAGAIGMNRHQTPLEAWMAITGRDSFAGNKATLRGTLLEPVVLGYPERDGVLARRPAEFVVHGNGWAADSSDCLYVSGNNDTYVGEGKTAALTMADEWGEEGTDEIPQHVLVQDYWHMGHWPETAGTVTPVLIGGYTFEFREYFVPRDAELIGQIFEAAERFHRDYVVNDRPPPATDGDDEALKVLYPREVPEKFIPATGELEKLTRAYAVARGLAKQYEAEKKTIGARLRQLLGDAEGARGGGWKVTYKWQATADITDWDALVKHLGGTADDIRKFTKPGAGARHLRAWLAGEKKGKAAA